MEKTYIYIYDQLHSTLKLIICTISNPTSPQMCDYQKCLYTLKINGIQGHLAPVTPS